MVTFLETLARHGLGGKSGVVVKFWWQKARMNHSEKMICSAKSPIFAPFFIFAKAKGLSDSGLESRYDYRTFLANRRRSSMRICQICVNTALYFAPRKSGCDIRTLRSEEKVNQMPGSFH
jgi:hypothetical protein